MYSLAMCINVPFEQLKKRANFNPSEVVHPNAKEPYCFRGCSYFDLAQLALKYNFSLMMFTSVSQLSNGFGDSLIINTDLEGLMDKYDGIVCYGAHAVAWDHVKKEYYNCDSYITKQPNGVIDCFMPCLKIQV